MNVRPKSEWLASNAMTIVLAVVAFQQAYNTFNNDTGQRLAKLEEWKSAATVRIQELSGQIRELERGRGDAGRH